MSAIKPTIGRKVWYWPVDGGPGVSLDATEPFDATLVFVHDSVWVNLHVVDHRGNTFTVERVALGEDAVAGQASWMPYQLAQAAAQVPAGS